MVSQTWGRHSHLGCCSALGLLTALAVRSPLPFTWRLLWATFRSVHVTFLPGDESYSLRGVGDSLLCSLVTHAVGLRAFSESRLVRSVKDGTCFLP